MAQRNYHKPADYSSPADQEIRKKLWLAKDEKECEALIRAAREEIQDGWSDVVRRQRAGGEADPVETHVLEDPLWRTHD